MFLIVTCASGEPSRRTTPEEVNWRRSDSGRGSTSEEIFWRRTSTTSSSREESSVIQEGYPLWRVGDGHHRFVKIVQIVSRRVKKILGKDTEDSSNFSVIILRNAYFKISG